MSLVDGITDAFSKANLYFIDLYERIAAIESNGSGRRLSDVQDFSSSSFIYYGWSDVDGWVIRRVSLTDGSYQDVSGSTDFSTEWAARTEKF